MSSIRLRTVALGLAVLALAAAPALAQAPTTGSIYGAVFNDVPEPEAGVTVTVTGPMMMGVKTTVTNEEGLYRFPTLPVGVYQLSFEKAGFETIVRRGLPAKVNASSMAYIQLKRVAQQSTSVAEGTGGVAARDTNVTGNITSDQAKDIPNARDIWALIGVAPGTTVSRFDVGGSGAGTQVGYTAAGLNDQTRTQIDGVNATEGTSGTGYFNYGAFAEVQVGTASNDASMPSPGAQTNAVLKTGTNKHSVDLYFDYENSKLQGANVTDALQRLGVGQGQKLTRYYDLNVLAGGPIKKDRLWYFVSARSQKIGTLVTGYPVESPGAFKFPTSLGWITEKVNFQLSPTNRISHYIEFRIKLQPRRGAASNYYSDAVYEQNSLSPYGNIEWEKVVSNSFFYNLRFGSWGYNWTNRNYGPNYDLAHNVQTRKTENQTGNITGGYEAGRNYRRRWQLDWSGVLFKDHWAGGDHTFKMAYLYEWELYRPEVSGYQDGYQLYFNSPAGAADFTTPYRVQINNSPLTPDNALGHHGAYILDQIQIGRKLSLNAGIRVDKYRNYYRGGDIQDGPWRNFFYAGAVLPNGYSIPASFPTFKYDGGDGVVLPWALAPRFALSFDPQGNGKTALKLNWGRYFYNVGPRSDIIPITKTGYTFGWNDVDQDRQFDTGSEFGNFVSSTGGTHTLVDPNLKHPYTDDLSVWVERQILSTLSGRVVFIYRKSNHPFQNIELNRVGSLYTQIVPQVDPGPDGLVGSGDDGAPFNSWDIPVGVTLPRSQTMVQTPADYQNHVRSIDVTVNKRMSQNWSASATFLYNWSHLLYGNANGGIAQNPNEAVNNVEDITDRAMKFFGSYRAPWGISISPVVRYQAGTPMRRAVQLTNLRSGTFNFSVEPFGAYRSDDIWLFDVRAEKQVSLPMGQQIGVFFDAFNINNSNRAQTQDEIVGRRTATLPSGEKVPYARFMAPTVILSPRIFRIGLKYSF